MTCSIPGACAGNLFEELPIQGSRKYRCLNIILNLQAGWSRLRQQIRRWRQQESDQGDGGDEVKPPSATGTSDRPLGMVKFVIKGVDLEEDQPYGAYFLVFK